MYIYIEQLSDTFKYWSEEKQIIKLIIIIIILKARDSFGYLELEAWIDLAWILQVSRFIMSFAMLVPTQEGERNIFLKNMRLT